MIRFAYVVLWSIVFALSFIEASGFIDTHHDFLMIMGAYLVEHGKVPYVDYYEQYGILQPSITAILFKIFGHKLAVQSILFSIIYATVVTNIGLITDRITKNQLAGLLSALVFFMIEPYAQFPWPNYILALLTTSGIIFFLNYWSGGLVYNLYISVFLIALTSLVRSNTGVLLPALYGMSVFIYFLINKNLKCAGVVLPAMSPFFVAIALFAIPDYYIQAIRLPREILIPYYFRLPVGFQQILDLHYTLFFQIKPLSSSVTPVEVLYLWRYMLIAGVGIGSSYLIYTLFKRQYRYSSLCGLLMFAALLESSTVFPIFDGFRAACAWYPFYIISMVTLYFALIRKFFIALALAFFAVLLGVNLKSNQSILDLVSRYNFNFAKLQFIDFTNREQIVKFESEFLSEGANPSSKQEFIKSGLDHSLSYNSFYNVIQNNCKNKKFISYLPNFYLYFLQENFQDLLGHKLYMSLFVTTPSGDPVDSYSMLYPNYFENIQSFSEVCILLPMDAPSYYLKNAGRFNQIYELSGSRLYVR